MPTQQISITCLFLPPTTTTALVLSSFALGREGGMEILCFEGIKLTCRMEAAREEKNRINQPPSPSTHTHTQAQWIGFHTSRNIPFCPLRQHVRSSTRSYTSPDMHQGLQGRKVPRTHRDGFPGNFSGVSSCKESPEHRTPRCGDLAEH